MIFFYGCEAMQTPINVPVPIHHHLSVGPRHFSQRQVTPYHVFNKEEHGKILKLIGWVPPPQGWLKINADGTWKTSSGIATAAGLIRDSHGNWCCGFAVKLANCSSAFVAELWGILTGLNLAWKAGFRNLIMETDSKTSVDTINENRKSKCKGSLEDFLITSIKEMLALEWNVKLQHQYREGNRVADALANLAVHLPLEEIVTLAHPPQHTIPLLIQDICGAKFPRMCAV